MDRAQYLLLMGACLLITLPLEVVLGARVYRSPRRLWRALWPMLVVFVAWDLIVIARDHWRFSERYTTGILLPGRVPLEEVVFFVVIPICGLLSLDTVRRILALIAERRRDRA
ncbi:MAG: lycopene cyclase domain-containing protein [Actinomycetes bacterium]